MKLKKNNKKNKKKKKKKQQAREAEDDELHAFLHYGVRMAQMKKKKKRLDFSLLPIIEDSIGF
ncbi:uncharacterized protein ARB_00007 [Trichophyton benhamiae CBS 112371]|uniref:Uncharacterized protein n=1 Tax=Arthroderma benhamiae (strain ATCC MYA-4681 / CBS 112371) TaxID=663331 RepID=D4AUZ8_ARTBC|nr:uncharacterized protein ARB_00007 [Trichophyton benhamiae CBS 112371]EFE32920.1 hypothetical protein ARB_00007 [Trichophyton benhamiae CBS 112371]